MILVLAKQRSGTNLFRSLLTTAIGIPDYDEVFLRSRSAEDGNFFCFLGGRGSEEGHRGALTEAAIYQLFDDYFTALSKRAESPFIFDVKYNSTLPLITEYYSPGEPPPLLKYCMYRGIPVFHLIRRNVLRGIISLESAGRGNVLHLGDGDPRPPLVPIQVSSRLIVGEIVQRLAEIAVFSSYFDGYRNYLEIEYNQHGFTPDAINRAAEVSRSNFGITYDGEPRTALAKIIVDHFSLVENMTDVESEIRLDGRFVWMLSENG